MSRRRSKTHPETDLPARILKHLETLGVSLTEEHLNQTLHEAENGSHSHLEFLERLLSQPAESRRQRAVERRIRQARFPGMKTLEDFDWQFNAQAIDRRQIEELATGDFIRRRDNLLMVGQSGVGKSHLLEGIGRRACLHGYGVRFTTSEELLADLVASLADGTMAKRVRYWSRQELLIIDGFGFDRIEREQTPQALSLLYKVIDRRNTRRSTALITNIDFDDWNEYLGDPVMVMALQDRLVYKAIMLKIEGKSYRAHQAQLLEPPGKQKESKSQSTRCGKRGGPPCPASTSPPSAHPSR
jgi:DNA replication protein DnaC